MRFLGFSTIQATGAGANMGTRIMEIFTKDQALEIIEEAVFNQELMATLLKRPTPGNTDFIFNRLRGHFGNVGADLGDAEEQEGVQF